MVKPILDLRNDYNAYKANNDAKKDLIMTATRLALAALALSTIAIGLVATAGYLPLAGLCVSVPATMIAGGMFLLYLGLVELIQAIGAGIAVDVLAKSAAFLVLGGIAIQNYRRMDMGLAEMGLKNVL